MHWDLKHEALNIIPHILTGRRAIGPVGKNFCHATRLSVIYSRETLF